MKEQKKESTSQAKPGEFLLSSGLIQEKDPFFWNTEIQGRYRSALGDEELAAALAKFDLTTEKGGDTVKSISDAKFRLSKWLNNWQSQNEKEEPPPKPKKNDQVHKFQRAKYDTFLWHPDKGGDNEEHESFTESFRTPYGWRIIIDIPDVPFRHMAAMIKWDKRGQDYHVFGIEAGHDLSDSPYLDQYFEGSNRADEDDLRQEEEKGNRYKKMATEDPDGFDAEFWETETSIDELAKRLGEEHEAVQAARHENHVTAHSRKMQEEDPELIAELQ